MSKTYPLTFRMGAHLVLGFCIGVATRSVDLATSVAVCIVAAIFLAVLFDISEGVREAHR